MKTKVFGTILCGAVLPLSGCGTAADTGKTANYARGGTYTTSLPSDPGNLHPLQAVQQTTNAVVPFAYDGLVNVNGAGKIVSGLASSWKVSPASVTFTLRKDVTCADGTRLTAKAVAANFDWVKNPKNRSTVIGLSLPDTNFTTKADDAAGTVTVTLAKPYGFLLQGAGLMPIVCPKGLADPKAVAHHTLGTGPFTLAEYVPDDHLTFTVRKDYHWGPGGVGTNTPGFPDKVVFKIVKDESTAANLLLSGQLSDASIGGQDRRRLAGRGFAEVTTLSGPQELWYNQRPGHPGADPGVRKALTMALDLDQLTKVVTQGSGVRASATAVLEPRPCRANTVQGALPPHDLAAAKAALDQAGWPAGPDGKRAKGGRPLKVTLLYSSEAGEAGAAGMELISQWWRQLGVDVTLRQQPTNATVQQLNEGNVWDVAWLSVALTYPNQLMAFAGGPPSPKGQNFAAVSNPDYDRLATQALRTPGDPGCALWGQADQALFRDVDVVPVSCQRVVTYGNKVRLAIGINGLEPTSLRLLAG